MYEKPKCTIPLGNAFPVLDSTSPEVEQPLQSQCNPLLYREGH